MKTSRAIGAISFLISGISIAEAGKDTMTVEAEGVEFTVERFDDARSKPYRIKFEDGGVASTYTFFADGAVNSFKVGSEKYRAFYKSDGDLRKVKLTSSRRRNLAEEEEDADDAMLHHQARRALYACDDCEEAWDMVCDSGVPSVCDLVDYGSPLSAQATASLETVCNTFGGACSASGGMETCQNQCEGDDDPDDDGECVIPLYVTLDWYEDGALVVGADFDIHVIEPSGVEVSGSNLCGDYGFHDVTQDGAIENEPEDYVLYSNLSGNDMLGDYTVFAEWYDGQRLDLGSVPWTLTAFLYGEVLWVEEGELDPTGPGGDKPRTASFTATLAEYIPNDNCVNNRGFGTQC